MKIIIYIICIFIGSSIITIGKFGALPTIVVYGLCMLLANKIIGSIEEKKGIENGTMIKCPNCGALNNQESTYCKNCGSSLNSSFTEEPVSIADTNQKTNIDVVPAFDYLQQDSANQNSNHIDHEDKYDAVKSNEIEQIADAYNSVSEYDSALSSFPENDPISTEEINDELEIVTEKSNDYPKIMYCRFCGAKLEEDSVFCAYCGKRLM